jgi:sugar fermentation stimulation protein A
MRFQTDLIPARLTRRYKRFLADCVLEDGREVTAHCANPGSMKGLAEPGTKIWLEPNDDPKKKLKFAWRLVEHQTGNFTGVDTGAANRVVKEALAAGKIPQLTQYESIRAEVKYGSGSRVDFLLSQDTLPDLYLEVKSVTLSRQGGLAEFPDSVTARGTKHLQELAAMVRAGHRAMMLYLVQRTDCHAMCLAADIDPAYAAAFQAAQSAGVDVLALRTDICPSKITAAQEIEFLLDAAGVEY